MRLKGYGLNKPYAQLEKAMRKLTHAKVEAKYRAAGYTLLSQYENVTAKMRVLCPAGHQYQGNWQAFSQGGRCPECAKAIRGQTKKQNTALKAKAAFQAEGYTLLDDYTDSHTPMRFRCPAGHEHQLSWTNFDAGYRCAFCSGHEPIDPQQVRLAFEAEGYRLLDNYTNSKKRMRFICPASHKWSISLSNWNAGHRCIKCQAHGI